jgi:hypothetical protein
MAKLISIASKIIEQLEKEGRVKHIPDPFTYEDMLRFEKIKRESRRKLAASWLDARNTILD